MEVRFSHAEDLPAILELFRMSLGEAGGLPSPQFWQWKHEQNPFGQSPTLLAFENGKLVGLRTFLAWRFRCGEETFKAYRAVDTATHPDFRGRGIFRKLTLGLVDQLKEGENTIIFNTPNAQSMPGYLKMGWNVMGKTPLSVMFTPFSRLTGRRPQQSTAIDWDAIELCWDSVRTGFAETFHGLMTTDYSIEFLKWRYNEVPGFTYGARHVKEGDLAAVVFYRMKQSGGLRELRITDLFFSMPVASLVRRVIREAVADLRPDVVTMLRDKRGIIKSLQPIAFVGADRFGLNITCREVNDPLLATMGKELQNWYFSAGTIELL